MANTNGQEMSFLLSMDAFTKNVEIRSSLGRRVAVVKAMASEAMTLEYADIMCAALNAAKATASVRRVDDGRDHADRF